MGSPCPPHWTFAARAAYFGDRMCPFCDHRNPAGAKFCNDCASPLHLKPCSQCDAVNHHAATNCYKCGAACRVSPGTPETTPVLPVVDATPAGATPGDVTVAATATQPLSAASALLAYWRLFRPGEFLLAAIATILIAGSYAAYRVNAPTPDAPGVASQSIDAHEHNAPASMPAVPVAVGSKPVEPETIASLEPPIPATSPPAPERASARQRAVPGPVTKRASAHQRLVPQRQAPVAATPPVAHTVAAAHANGHVAQTRKALRADPWQLMHVSLARCGGDLIARILCNQRVRRHFCEGHWGEAPHCASGVANEHGQ